MKRFLKYAVLFLLLLQLSPFLGNGVYAQLYPVQVTPIFNSPYSVRLSEYATSMDTKMQLLINPTDITISQRQVRLKMYLQGNGLNVQSSDYIQGLRPIFINGGELQTLTNTDIAALFRLENLQGITALQYANGLPEGMYSFCFELYDFVTNQKISQKSCASLYLLLNDPPLLNTPQRNEKIAATDFPNILFTWTPRQRNATNVSYRLELKQLLDPTLDPQIAFQMSPILYEETLFGTALLYHLNMPMLLPGMRYAWRVKAISTTGLSENSVFKNDGYSEIYSFTYKATCAAPTFLLSESQPSKSVKITWQGTPAHTRYQVQYKKEGVRNAQWFSTLSLNTQSLLTNLEPGVSYQFRVGASCEPASEGDALFSYSDISTFTMPKEAKEVSEYNCGIVPSISLQNQTPLTNLIQSETFTAGDFPVTILELSGKSPYSGRGFIVVPYLAGSKIAVEFKDIVINTDYQLIGGVVETSYNPEWKNVVDVEELFNDLSNSVNDLYDLLKKKEEGSITDEEFVKEKLEHINKIQDQFDELKKEEDLPAELKEKIEDLKPVLLDLASNDWTASGNSTKENISKIAEVAKEVEIYKKANCQDLDDGKIVLQNVDDYKIYSTPVGNAIILRNATNLDLESIYPNETYPDLKVPKGALVAFTKGIYSFKAKYRKESNKWKFIGYFSKEGNEYLDTDTSEFRNKYRASGNNKESVALVLGAGASTELSKSVLVSLGETAGLTAEGAILFRNVTGVAMLAYIIIETFVVTSTVTPVYHGYVLDLPETTPIVTQNIDDDSYVKNPPASVPISIPHALPKDETGNKGCQVYCIYKIEKLTKKLTIAKYGMTCQNNFKSDGKQDCNPRPEYQTRFFNKTDIDFTFNYTWVTPVEVSKEMAYIIETSMIAVYVRNNEGKLPSHHFRPCFVQGDIFEKEQERMIKATKWIADQIAKYGK